MDVENHEGAEPDSQFDSLINKYSNDASSLNGFYFDLFESNIFHFLLTENFFTL